MRFKTKEELLAILDKRPVEDYSNSPTPFIACIDSTGSGIVYKSIRIFAPGAVNREWVQVYSRKFNSSWVTVELTKDGELLIRDAKRKEVERIDAAGLSMEYRYYSTK